MEFKREKIKEALEKAFEDKGKRKFTQSVEFIVNFKGIDFSKPENRLNLHILLPKGKGKKANKVVVIASEAVAHQAKKAGADVVVTDAELEEFARDVKRVKKLAKDHVFLAEPKLMGLAARFLGKILGPRGKIPRPLVGDVAKAIENARRAVQIQTKGKYLPTVQTFVGTEEMDIEDILDNIEAVVEEIRKKIPPGNIKNAYVKLTMGKAVKIAG